VAETANNLLNSLCYSNSDFFEVKINEPKEPIKNVSFNMEKEKNDKTYKKIIIVKDGFKIIHDKVWFDGAIGKFVQTGEEIITQGDFNGIIVIDETVYYKGIYGYNSKTRRYSIKP